MKFSINCDLGEGMTNDSLIMPFIDECNIACGGHYGNDNSISEAIILAKNHNILIGAHPSYPDKLNFGRHIITLSNDKLAESLYEQLVNFCTICSSLNVEVNHVKLHGALYNLSCVDLSIAHLIIDVYKQLNLNFKIFTPFKSALSNMAKNYFDLRYEAFIDRRYNNDLSLVNRNHCNALIVDKLLAYQQTKSIYYNGMVESINGNIVQLKANTFCIHSDNPNVLAILKHLNSQFLVSKC